MPSPPIPELFRSQPEDSLHLFRGCEPNSEKVVRILEYTKKDVALAANVPTASVRYDTKMPVELRDRLVEWATAINLVGTFFNDVNKTILWFKIPNPLLGNIAPRDMIRIGRFPKLLKFIHSALEQNRR